MLGLIFTFFYVSGAVFGLVVLPTLAVALVIFGLIAFLMLSGFLEKRAVPMIVAAHEHIRNGREPVAPDPLVSPLSCARHAASWL